MLWMNLFQLFGKVMDPRYKQFHFFAAWRTNKHKATSSQVVEASGSPEEALELFDSTEPSRSVEIRLFSILSGLSSQRMTANTDRSLRACNVSVRALNNKTKGYIVCHHVRKARVLYSRSSLLCYCTDIFLSCPGPWH